MFATLLRRPTTLVRLLAVALAAAAGAAAGSLITIALLAPSAELPAAGSASAAERASDESDVAAVDAPITVEPGDAGAAAAAERAQLAQSVLALSRRGDALERRLDALAKALEAERAASRDAPSFAEGALPSGEPTAGIVSDGTANDDAATEADAAESAPRDRVAALVAAGLDPQSASELEARRDAFELARLELVDRATREGWRDSGRFDAELETLEADRPDLRETLGDAGYDRFLYARGESNRVRIGSIIGGSAAELAGVEVGDVVLSYADERMFGMRELQRATRAGERGEYVQLVVSRDGEPLAIDVPRGPLGVTLRAARLPPL